MKPVQQFTLFILVLLITSCITEFIPEINEERELLVVEGLITDQPGPNTIKLSKSLPLGKKSDARPLSGCEVKISDDLGNVYSLNEMNAGTYVTNAAEFKGETGRLYTLQISVPSGNQTVNYESFPVEMKPVPPIDSIYYEKTVIDEPYENYPGIDGCQIYLDTHDPENKCRFFRWDYAETWVLRLLFPVPNMKCWISDSSENILIKSTTAIAESRISGYPISFISNVTDRLKTKYSIEVNQYSLDEDEYIFWERLQNLTEQVGGLYDIIPASIPSNIWCVEKPDEKVLGYFSVSAKSSKRIFIQDNFAGIIDLYPHCPTDTVYGEVDIPGLNVSVWVLSDNPIAFPKPRTRILTDDRGCADCTVRGTTKKPDFWTGE